MFQVGDKVFYPMHGAGVIEAIEEREIQGEIREYYLITIPSSNLNIMIPMNTVSKTGVRSVVDRKTLKDILHDFHNVASDCELPWRQRFNTNTEKLKSGRRMRLLKSFETCCIVIMTSRLMRVKDKC